MNKYIDLKGQKFGKLTVIERTYNSKHKAAQWRCKCECGNEVIVSSNNLRTGHTKSCGCSRKETNSKRFKEIYTKHGQADTRLYVVWSGIKKRIHNENDSHYQYYGGRGITICEEWDNDFACFYKWAMENGYNPNAPYGECTIDRINPNGNYEPNNCRWVNLNVQAKNKRKDG